MKQSQMTLFLLHLDFDLQNAEIDFDKKSR
jgi:hypothetical protein